MVAKLILWFEEIGRESVAVVGGKSANLGEMLRIGVSVPGGFAITSEAYDRFMKETGTAQEISQYLSKFLQGLKSTSEYQEASEFIRHTIEAREIPQDIGEAIASHYDMLCEKSGVTDVPVAVRSSGVAEDLDSASFAGQYESYLNVIGKQELLKKTRECWSSQFTTRAITYRIKNELPTVGSSMCIGVQRMVHPRAAGVGFTAHPITGDSSKIVLEGNWGLGESIVQGMVTPDRYVIDKQTLNLVEKNISNKGKLIEFGEHGIVAVDVPIEKQQLPCLSDEEAVKLAELAKFLELHYGMSQDVEWAIDGDLPFPSNVFLVQTRPITVSRQKKEGEDADYIVDLMINLFRQIRRG